MFALIFPKGNTEYTQIVSSPLAFAAPKEDYRNTLLLQPLWPNRIAFVKLLLATSKMRIAWHQHTLTQGEKEHFGLLTVYLWLS